MSDESKIESTHVRIEPTGQVTRAASIPVLAADHAMVLADHGSQMCTFVFYQRHPNAKVTSTGIQLTSVEEEAVLEVKMPFSTAFGLVIYMNALLKEMQGKPIDMGRSDFGPVSIKQVSRPNEEKKQ
jgi:hypothetical protein